MCARTRAKQTSARTHQGRGTHLVLALELDHHLHLFTRRHLVRIHHLVLERHVGVAIADCCQRCQLVLLRRDEMKREGATGRRHDGGRHRKEDMGQWPSSSDQAPASMHAPTHTRAQLFTHARTHAPQTCREACCGRHPPCPSDRTLSQRRPRPPSWQARRSRRAIAASWAMSPTAPVFCFVHFFILVAVLLIHLS
jgi:hypothetical protein